MLRTSLCEKELDCNVRQINSVLVSVMFAWVVCDQKPIGFIAV